MQTADGSTIGSICSIALQVLREGGNGAICHANGNPTATICGTERPWRGTEKHSKHEGAQRRSTHQRGVCNGPLHHPRASRTRRRRDTNQVQTAGVQLRQAAAMVDRVVLTTIGGGPQLEHLGMVGRTSSARHAGGDARRQATGS